MLEIFASRNQDSSHEHFGLCDIQTTKKRNKTNKQNKKNQTKRKENNE